MNPFLDLINNIISLIIFILILQVIMSWLIAFNIINSGNRFIGQINYSLYKLTRPLLAPIQNLLPNIAGLDVSPAILIIILWFIRDLLAYYF